MKDDSDIVHIDRRSPREPEGEDGRVGVLEDIQHERRRAIHKLSERTALLINHPTRLSASSKRRNTP